MYLQILLSLDWMSYEKSLLHLEFCLAMRELKISGPSDALNEKLESDLNRRLIEISLITPNCPRVLTLRGAVAIVLGSVDHRLYYIIIYDDDEDDLIR